MSTGPGRASQADGVQVWHFDLDVDGERYDRLAATLSDDERSRADRYRFERDRYRFVSARGTMREILAACLGMAPGNVEFRTGRYGKPYLPRAGGAPDLRFNLSHSHGVALLAVTEGADLGIDVEEVRPFDDVTDVAGTAFSPEEYAHFSSLPEFERVNVFYTLWTAREAYLKALGLGLGTRLQDFAFVFEDDVPNLRSSSIDNGDPGRWAFFMPRIGEAVRACLCVEDGADAEVTVARWPLNQP